MAADLNRIPEFYHGYVSLVKEDTPGIAFRVQNEEVFPFLQQITAEKSVYRYANDKWSVKELLQHITDTERIFSYRALCIARGDTTPLPGFNENSYAANSKADNRKWNDLLEDFRAVRRSTEILFASFDKDQLNASGTANGKYVYVEGIGFIIAGHVLHHVKMLKERYL
jgi:hypothetical protein